MSAMVSIQPPGSFPTVQTNFGLSMLRQSPLNESLVVSPISVIFALAMVQAGAKGTTKSQISKVIAGGASDTVIQNYYSSLSSEIKNAKNGVQSRIANGFFLNKQYTIEKSYQNVITTKYGATVQSLDFGKAAAAANVIDSFISKTTDNKIQNMVTADTVEGAFSVLVNAVYFTAKWLSPFDKASNSNETFYGVSGKKREVEYMNSYAEQQMYAEDEDVQVVSLPYQDSSYALNILLPKDRSGLCTIRPNITGERIQSLLSNMATTSVTEALIAMGVTAVFSDSADLSGITKKPPLMISAAAHRAIIEVDEDGTTAAAATVLALAGGAFQETEPKHFIADHAFLFILTKDRNPLFMGQFV